MPANLTPQYHKAEEEYRRAGTPEEELRCLEVMVQSVVSLRLQGVTFVEIADRLHINERTARKAIEKLTGDSVCDPNAG